MNRQSSFARFPGTIFCPICGASSISSCKEVYIDPYFKNEYKLYSCNICDLDFWEPRKIIPEFYEEEFLDEYYMRHSGLTKKPRYYHLEFFENFRIIGNLFNRDPVKLLDIGCGNGTFIKEAQKLGLEVWGIDLDKNSIKCAQNLFGLRNTFVMDLESFVNYALNKNLKFDIITFFEVLEHQDDPRKFIQNIKKILNIPGIIAGTVPNRDNFFSKRFSRISLIDYPPNHFLRFSKKSLEFLLDLEDFNQRKVYDINLSFFKFLKEFEKYLLSHKVIEERISKFFLKLLFGPEYTLAKRRSTGMRKRIYKTLKFVKSLTIRPLLIPFVLYLKSKVQMPVLYFQGILR
ncbi:class I SAM-dependent methyltransferase [Thermosulfurimonas dismutans]|uniref:Class I SAM-dependent methyltransferase n=1 Tax=Thermosulfurimonas dismutans TaxID=999894 RepID=A0A179D778_9BACT|nr:class I SAM-dependent methyltransferase [Thermosulfurimonas dismutans]OAQ21823.1 hypothetical protein TDIS_0341 [Thermosulfurimonas dismutans]